MRNLEAPLLEILGQKRSQQAVFGVELASNPAEEVEPVAVNLAGVVGAGSGCQLFPGLGVRFTWWQLGFRLDDAELYVTCDNRMDELRLLGNGVVPATAELAFRTLCDTTCQVFADSFTR